MKYRITVTYTKQYVVEGEGSLEYMEERADELRTGAMSEEPNEVSSFRNLGTQVNAEFLVDEDEDLWAELLISGASPAGGP